MKTLFQAIFVFWFVSAMFFLAFILMEIEMQKRGLAKIDAMPWVFVGCMAAFVAALIAAYALRVKD